MPDCRNFGGKKLKIDETMPKKLIFLNLQLKTTHTEWYTTPHHLTIHGLEQVAILLLFSETHE